MRIGVFILFNLLGATVVAVAGEKLPQLKAGTNTYTHVAVFKVTATDLYFTCDKGMANVKLKNLDPDLQKHFNYNLTNAIAVEQMQKTNNNLYHLEISKPTTNRPADRVEEVPYQPSATEPGKGKPMWARPFLNQPAPPIIVEKWLSSQPDNQGKFVLVEFWATWDPASRAAIPVLNDYQKQFGSKLVVIGLSDESEDAVRKMTDPKMEYAVAIDTQSRTKSITQVTAVPHVLIVDPHGIVRWEGFPLLKGYELSGQVVADILNRYSN